LQLRLSRLAVGWEQSELGQAGARLALPTIRCTGQIIQTMNSTHKTDGSRPADSREPMIEAIGLSKFYGVFAAARDVTFTVRKGELVAFLGPNGAGKSTTMKMLTGYLAPSLGTARIAGHDMSTGRLAGSSRLGYLPENGPLYPDETPHSLLEFFADARGLEGSYKKQRIGAVIDLCALGSVIYRPISKLSKGFRQRVGMAHALLHEPDVLIMDEPPLAWIRIRSWRSARRWFASHKRRPFCFRRTFCRKSKQWPSGSS